MKTIKEKTGKEQLNRDAIARAGEILRSGGLVAIPTETVYGLAANALDEEAARKTYAAKGRPSDNPLIVHIARISDLGTVAKHISEKARKLAETFWPGPMTMIFDKTECVPYGTTGGLDTVAVRMPSDPIAREVILAGGGFISAPSANTSGRPSPTTAQHVAEDLDGKIDMILDGGAVDIGVESTIVDMTVEPPMILRPGAVTKEMLEACIGEVAVDVTLKQGTDKQAPKAPGMKYKHYAPKADLQLIVGDVPDVVAAMQKLAAEKEAAGIPVGIIATEESKTCFTQGVVKVIGSRGDEESIAKNLYGILREFDEENVRYIYSEEFQTEGIGAAIMNRLLKAAGYQRLQASQILTREDK
jgi:L-threonylcarbamoyladenylate synthase